MYVNPNFPTKKALREAVKEGKTVSVFSPGRYPCPQSGQVAVEGPHFPKSHSWYAEVMVEDGLVKSVK